MQENRHRVQILETDLKVVNVPDQLDAVRHAETRGVSQRRACRLLSVSRSMLVYRHRMPGRDAPLLREFQAVAAGVLRERSIKRAHRVWR